jgi:hypothetical protein
LAIAVIGLAVALAIVLRFRKSSRRKSSITGGVSEAETNTTDTLEARSSGKSTRYSRLADMYSRLRKSKVSNKDDVDACRDSNVYDDVQLKPQLPGYNAGHNNYTNAPDDHIEVASTSMGDETESQIYAEPPDN